jgi:4-amino-4-deoxy-L-arabinose transferase-like glycosyltransferase
MTKKQKFLFGFIILLAIFFRFYQIKNMPGGLFPDEAANGLDINSMQQGHFQPFYERGNGREALFFYMEWASTVVFGKGQWQMHVVSSLIGVLSIIAVYFVTRRLFLVGVDQPDEYDNKKAINIALLAAFLMAVSTWHVVLSRTALRANLTPLFGALTLYFLLCTYQSTTNKAKYWFAILTGLALGLGFYTYIAFRVMLPILFMILVWPLLAAAKRQVFKLTIKKYWKLFVVAFLTFGVSISWIVNYFYHNFVFFIGRSGQVSVFNQSLYLIDGQPLLHKPDFPIVLSVLWTVTKTAVAGFFTHGDLNWRQNISGFPLLSPLISPFFGIGLIIISLLGIWYFFAPSKRSKYWKYFLLTGWFWGMMLPEIATAEGIPHGLRSAGVIAPTFIICAWALYEFVQIVLKLHTKLWKHHLYQPKDPDWMKQKYFTPVRMRIVNIAFKVLALSFFVALIFQTYFLYFVYAAASPEYFYAFRADLTPVSKYLVDRCNKPHTFFVLDTYWLQTTDYLTSDPKGNFDSPCSIPYQKIEPSNAWQLPVLEKQDEVIFTQSTLWPIKGFLEHHPNFYLSLEYRNQFNQTIMAVYKMK